MVTQSTVLLDTQPSGVQAERSDARRISRCETIFCDLDGTLSTSWSLELQFTTHLANQQIISRTSSLAAHIRTLCRRDRALRYKPYLAKLRRSLIDDVATRWVSKALCQQLNQPLYQRLQARRQMGAHVILVTYCPDFLAAPIVRWFALDGYIAPTLLTDPSGRYTGGCHRAGLPWVDKGTAVQAWARRHQINLALCTAYGNSPDDISMFQAVGRRYWITTTQQEQSYAPAYLNILDPLT